MIWPRFSAFAASTLLSRVSRPGSFCPGRLLAGCHGCSYVVGLTVSRGPLFAIALAAVVGARRLLKRGFIPILVLVPVAWLVYLSGLFDQAFASYQGRLTEETGRLQRVAAGAGALLGLALVRGRSCQSWELTSQAAQPVTPHNGFLHVGLSSGLVPLFFFVAYWWRSGREALSKARQSSPDGLFHVPLWVYAFLVNFQLNNTFMAPWSVGNSGLRHVTRSWSVLTFLSTPAPIGWCGPYPSLKSANQKSTCPECPPFECGL